MSFSGFQNVETLLLGLSSVIDRNEEVMFRDMRASARESLIMTRTVKFSFS